MKLKTLKVNVTLEFESVQPAELDEKIFERGLVDGIKQSVPKGCRISDVRIRNIGEFEGEKSEIIKDLKKEIAEFKEQERKNIVEDIASKRFTKTYGKS